jgi:hypothetical protein
MSCPGAGIRDAALLMDDLDPTAHPHGTQLGQAHAALASTLLASMTARDAGARLWFVPTVYSGTASALAQGDADYVRALSALPRGVGIGWTGPGVISKDIQLADGVAFVGLAGRAAPDLFVWDNYPANDVAVFRSLYTRPITGRDTLLPSSGGLLTNPMRHALASVPAIASYAELSLDPSGYTAARAAGQPLASADLALLLADGDAPPRALADFFAELVHHDTIWPNDLASPALTQSIAKYQAATTPGADRRAAALDLATRLARLALADADLRRDLDDRALSDEIDAFARVTSAAARATLDALAGDRAAVLGDGAAADAAHQHAACAWTFVTPPAWTTIQAALAPLVPQSPSNCAAPTGDPLGNADAFDTLVGQPMQLTLTDAENEPTAEWSVVGPDGMTIGGDGSLQWTPPRLGHYRVVVLRNGDAGVAARALDVIVVESLPQAPAESGCSCRDAPRTEAWHGGWLAAAAVALGWRRRRRP